jgi:GT2 family glycosyltransferase
VKLSADFKERKAKIEPRSDLREDNRRSERPIDVGIVLVHYHNGPEVARFLQNVRKAAMPEGGRRHVVIVDNGGDARAAGLVNRENVLLVRPTRNLGYANGCSWGIKVFRQHFEVEPTWWMVTNSDLQVSPAFFQRLLRTSWPETVGVLAPDVREEAWPCNPFLLTRPSVAQLRWWLYVLSTPGAATMYRYLSLVKRRIGRPSAPPVHPRSIYAPHGSLMVMHRRFFEQGGRLGYGGFLYGEELHVAEQARTCDLTVWWSPLLQACHYTGGVTGSLSAARRRKWMRESLEFVYRTYFEGDAAG